MAIKVANTTFETTPGAKIAVVDVYAGTVPIAPTNSEVTVPGALKALGLDKISSKGTTELFSSVTKVWQDNSKSLSDVFKEIKNVTKDSKAFKENLTNAVLGDVLASVGYKGSGSDIAKIIKGGANTTSILNVIGNIDPGLKTVVGDVEKIIGSNDLDTATGVANMIGQLSGNADLLKILNISPKMSVVKGVIDVAMKLGLGHAADKLIDSMETREEQRQLRLFSCINAAMGSDLDFLTRVMDDEKIGIGAILALYPDILEVLFMNYKAPTLPMTRAQCDKLMNITERFDKKWMTYNRNGIEIPSLRMFTSASDDAIKTLMFHPDARVPAMLSRTTVSTDMVTSTLALRPFTPKSILTL